MSRDIRVLACCLVVTTVTATKTAHAAACNGGNCPAANFVVTGVLSPQSAGTVSSVTVEVRTSAGARATGYTGTIRFTSTDAQALLPANYRFTSSTAATPNCTTGCDQGIHTFTNAVVLKTAGTQSMTATDVAKATVKGSQTGIVVQANTPSRLVVSGITTPRTAGTASSITVEVKDAFGNRVTSYTGTVTFSSSDPQATLPASYQFRTGTGLDNGIHTFTNGVTLKTAGSQSVTATDAVNGSITGSQSGIQVNPAAASTLAVSGIATPRSLSIPSSVTVEARDGFGNRATTYHGTVRFSSSDASAVLPANYTFTVPTTATPCPTGGCDNGIHTFANGVVLKTAGSQSVSATDTVTATIAGAQTGIVVVSDIATRFAVSGVPSSLVAGTPASVRVEARDAADNVATGYTGTVQITTTDSQAATLAHTFAASDNGVFVFTDLVLKTAGTHSVSATDVANASVTGSQGGIVVDPASATRLAISGLPATATAGDALSATVTAFDPYDNVATGYLGTVRFSSSDPLATPPPDRAFLPGDLGQANVPGFVLRSAGSQSVSASDTLTPALTSSQTVLVVAGSAASLSVSGFPPSITAGVAGALTVTAADPFGNVAASYAGTVAFSSTDPRAVLPASATFSSADSGTRTFAVVLKTAGSQSISVSDGALATVQTSSSVAPATTAALIVSGITTPIPSGSVSSVTVEARDEFANRTPSYSGTISFASSDPGATLPAPYTFVAADGGIHAFADAVRFAGSGTHSVTATDGTIFGSQTGILVTDGIAPTWPLGSKVTGQGTSPSTAHLTWTAATDNVAVAAYRVYKNGVLDQTVSGLSADIAGLTVGTPVTVQVQAGDAAGNWSVDGPSASVTAVPRDPQLVAPPLDMTVSTTIASATSFLYTGPDAVQTGVAPGTIEQTRAAVVRGLVRDRAAQPLAAVKVSVLNHPEYGNTWSRADGRYDLAVNGGDRLTFKYERSDLLPVQRPATLTWQDYTDVPDVVMVPYDGLATMVSSGAPQAQLVRGSVSTDDIGSRQTAVFIPPGTSATIVMPDGTSQSLSTFHVRATELTVGADGPRAMPGTLPAMSAYTYAAAFTADEAVTAGASHVQFSQPVFGYLENFLSFPVGMTMPSGSYDSVVGRWLPESNGRVLKVLSVSGGSAVLDTNGDGMADDAATLAMLEISNSELVTLGSLYQAGQSIWRVPMLHFSFVDWNVGLGLPPDPTPPGPPPFDGAPPDPNPCQVAGCIVDVQNQALGEKVSLVGIPHELNYRSDRVPGRRAAYRLNLTVPGARTITLPAGVTVCLPNRTPECQQTAAPVQVPASLRVQVAGKAFVRQNFDSTPLAWSFEWDGKDAYGRALQGEQPVTLTACYHYPGVGYTTPQEVVASFGQPSISGALTAWRWVGQFAQVADLCSSSSTRLGTWNVVPEGLGGWTLSAHHVLDVPNKTIYRGDGGLQKVDDLNRYVANVVAGGGSGTPVDGVRATTIGFGTIGGVLAAPDGSFYVAVWAFNSYIGRITPDGVFRRIAGTGPSDPKGAVGDGIPARTAALFEPGAMQFGPDGSLYFAEHGAIRRISPDGLIYTVAGVPPDPTFGGPTGFTADGAQAVGALLQPNPGSIAVGPDGTVYFAEARSHRIRRVGPDRFLRTLAGSGPTGGPFQGGFSGDGGAATSARLNSPEGVVMSPDGSLLIADSCNERIRRVTADGIIRTVAGAGGSICFVNGVFYGGDGGLATQGILSQVGSLATAPDGRVFVSDRQNSRVRRFAIGGNIDTVAGPSGGCGGVDCPATKVTLNQPTGGIAYGPAGDVYFIASNRIYHLTSAQSSQQIGLNNIVVPSRDASEVYVFDLNGRHVKTLDALTNAQTQVFGYDAAGKLVSVTDRSNNVTTIERDAQENPTAIVSPYGQRTPLTLDSDGYLRTITNPNAEMVQLFYKPVTAADPHSGGLLEQYKDARNGSAFYQYDNAGFLTQTTEPDGSFHTYSRGGRLAATSVTRTSALGRVQAFGLSQSANNDTQTRTTQGADGLVATQRRNADHSSSITQPDGTTVTTAESADPRFGIQAAYTSSTTTKTPSGLTRTESLSRSVALSNAQDPLSLSSLIESVTMNGRTSQSNYSAATRRMTLTSAAGRVSTLDYDVVGRVTQISVPGVLPLQLHYDVRGRNDTITQGTRVTTMSYRADGFLESILDPLQRTTSFDYDLAGRPTRQTLPGLTAVGIGYDANGNVASVTPPGRPAHVFAYTPADLEKDYTPPDVGQLRTTHTDYNLDQQVGNISRPDGDFITPTYDAVKGRLTALTTSRGANTYGYDATTGRLTTITTFDGVGLTYAYDGSLLTDITWSGPISGNVHKTYDSSFRLSSEKVTGGQTISFGYDNDDLPTSAGAMTITRDPATGFITGTTLGAISESRTYDAFGAEKTYTVTANGTTLYAVDYGTRDALGRIVNKTETIQGETHVFGYTYDANGRLTDVTKDGVATSHYEYDANGNRLVGPGLTASPVYDNQDRLLSYGGCTYTYKADGSLQKKTCPDGTTSYDYDSLGNLRGVTLPNGTVLTYLIDGQNHRIGKKVNGGLVEGFIYRSQLQPAVWLNGDNSVKATFVYGAKPNVPEYMIGGGTSYRFITDQAGSVRLVVNASTGGVAERIDWDEFGNVLADSAAGFQPFGFAGGLRDPDMQLTRFGARDYDAQTGRWMSKDPIRFFGGDADLFIYVNGDPINSVDPSGLALIVVPPGPPPPWTWPIIGATAGGVVGGAVGAAAGTFAAPGAGTVGFGLGGAAKGAAIGAAMGAAAAAGAMAADWTDPPPFYPGWKPPQPPPTICTVEPAVPPPPNPPQRDCALLFAQCIARWGKAALPFCLGLRLVCEFGG